MTFVANPVVSCFESAISMFLLGALQIQPWRAYRDWKKALKKKRLHKNKWFLKIIQTGINPTTPDLTGSTGFVTKNHKYFSPLTSRICKCFIWKNSVFFRHPVQILIALLCISCVTCISCIFAIVMIVYYLYYLYYLLYLIALLLFIKNL